MSKKTETSKSQPNPGLIAACRETLADLEFQRDEVLRRKDAHARDMAEAIESGNLAAVRRDNAATAPEWDEAVEELSGLEIVIARTTVLIKNLAAGADRIGAQANDVKVEIRKLKNEVMKLRSETHSLRSSLRTNISLKLHRRKSETDGWVDHIECNTARLIEILGDGATDEAPAR